jgi:hypothetical protein
LTTDEVNADIAMGVSDGTTAAGQSVDDILQWYSLKKQSDPRIRGLSFE